MKLIAYQDKDFHYLWDTYVSTMKCQVEKQVGWNDCWQKAHFKVLLDNYSTFVIEENYHHVGYVQFRDRGEKVYIVMLVLEFSHQSKGIGAAVLNQIQSESQGKAIELRCFQVNQRAFQFYSDNGFRAIDKDDDFILMRRESNSSA
ncbi:GNAT family N-acetyltransferase [Aliikangiella sp. G2MR2-5]|uniref:GNAT family N-acetyltransferase n=1 Tax=Aliikangiella sp. G2MR2-5 TaxID=2788943 RepID=UPI0018AA8861|nr:GNAT family N-acetyltransferase [Aliikangiella sp. G2MR2-5]